MKPEHFEHYESAKKKVQSIKGFYKHLTVFIVVFIVTLVGRFYIVNQWLSHLLVEDGFVNWLNWNTFIFPALWGIVILFHGLHVYGKLLFFKKWEAKKIQQLMDEEDNDTKHWK